MPHPSGALCGDRHPSGPSSTRRGEVAAALGGSARLSVARARFLGDDLDDVSGGVTGWLVI